MAEVGPVELLRTYSMLPQTTEETAPTVELGADPKEAYERGYRDINFFAALAAPGITTSNWPIFYQVLWKVLVDRKPEQIGKLLRFALGLPRGHAKTTFVKVVICWLIVYDKATFILILCANGPLAETLLADIHDMLGSPNMEAVYGPWTMNCAVDNAEMKKAMYHKRPVILVARGVDAGIRGLNIKHHRPDVIFCDDVQTKANDRSPTERQNLLVTLVSTVFKAAAYTGNRWIIYVGNMYSEECILNRFKLNSKWISLVTGAILENGQPLWPELHSLEDLMESFQHDEELGLSDEWFAEVMNDPKALATSLLNAGALPNCPYSDEELQYPDGCFITVDPAGFESASDDNYISVHYIYDGKGIVVERKGGAEISNPEDLVLSALSLAVKHGASLIGVESVGFQSTLQFWFTKYISDAEIQGLHIVPLTPRKRAKEQRIRLFVAELYAGNYYQSNSARPAFVYQATAYKLGKKDNKDDLLDSDAYGLDVRNEHWHLVTTVQRNKRTESVGVVTNNTPF